MVRLGMLDRKRGIVNVEVVRSREGALRRTTVSMDEGMEALVVELLGGVRQAKEWVQRVVTRLDEAGAGAGLGEEVMRSGFSRQVQKEVCALACQRLREMRGGA